MLPNEALLQKSTRLTCTMLACNSHGINIAQLVLYAVKRRHASMNGQKLWMA